MSTSSSLKPLVVLWFLRLVGLFIALLAFVPMCIAWLVSENRRNFWTPKQKKKPACLTDPSLGRHGYIQLKDVRLHYLENGDRKNPLMLLLHGFPECWYSWKNQLPAFSKTHWVVAVDLRGYGESDKPQGTDKYKTSILVEDVRQRIVKLGKEKCVLVAHDWGGLIGWMFAAKHPKMLSHFVALNLPHPAIFRKHLSSTLKQMAMSWYMFFFQIPVIPELVLGANDCYLILDKGLGRGLLPAGQDPTPVIEAYKYYFNIPGAWNGPVNYYRNIINSSSSIFFIDESLLRVSKVPCLLVFGKEDAFVDYRMAARCGQYVDDYQYQVIEAGLGSILRT